MALANRLQSHRMPPASAVSALRLQHALQLIAQIPAAIDPFDLEALLCSVRAPLCADVVAYLHRIPDPVTPGRLLALLACDAAIAYGFAEHGRHHVEEWLRHAKLRSGPLALSPKPQDDADPISAIRSLLLVPTHGGASTGRFGVLILGSHEAGRFESVAHQRERLLAQALATELHDWWTATTRRELLTSARLRSSDLRLLELQRQGYGTKQASSITGMTTQAIDSRFQRILAKMGVASRQTASQIAVIHELI